jgi:hypothetical protein
MVNKERFFTQVKLNLFKFKELEVLRYHVKVVQFAKFI